MAKATKRPRGKGPPDPRTDVAFRDWLRQQPREWSVVIAARAALRVLPLVVASDQFQEVVLPVFRANAISRFAGKYPNRKIVLVRIAAAARAAAAAARAYAADATASVAADAASAASAVVASAADACADASAIAAAADAAAAAAIVHDARRLHEEVLTAEQLAGERLWPTPAAFVFSEHWLQLKHRLHADGRHWQVWIDWYLNAVLHEPHHPLSEAQEAAFIDLSDELPWDEGAEAVNMEIARRLNEISHAEIPDQVAAPVRVEERDGKVSKVSDRDSPLNATERDFNAWREPVVEHIEGLTAFHFRVGTNHEGVRERLLRLGKLLPGEISGVKENQFKIGYEIGLFQKLMAAYRKSGQDMPTLDAERLGYLEHLLGELNKGATKLERWSEFDKQVNGSTTGEAEANPEVVGDMLDKMAAVMEQRPQYFHPELPATFRFLSESVRDPMGATKTAVYGAVKSVENLISFLGQKALGVGKKGAEAVENHISKAIAASLVAGLSGAALQLSGALPQGWAWLKPLLAALGIGG